MNKNMVLFLNTSKEKQLDVFLIKATQILPPLVIRGDFKVAEKLLKGIEQILRKNKVKLEQLSGLMAVSGPGPFTSLRIGLAVANTLAYTLKVPLVGLVNKKQKLTDEQLIKLGLKQLKHNKIGKYLQPFYDQEPNITISKK